MKDGITRVLSCNLLLLVVVLFGCDQEPQAWRDATTANTVNAYDDYLSSHPAGMHRAEATTAIAALKENEAWTSLGPNPSIQSLDGFVQAHPSGSHATEARQRIHAAKARLAWTDLGPTPSPTALRTFLQTFGDAPEATVARQKLGDLEWEAASQSDWPKPLETFITNWPDRPEIAKARQILEPRKLAAQVRLAWYSACAAHTPQAYKDFLSRFPDSPYRADAAFRSDLLAAQFQFVDYRLHTGGAVVKDGMVLASVNNKGLDGRDLMRMTVDDGRFTMTHVIMVGPDKPYLSSLPTWSPSPDPGDQVLCIGFNWWGPYGPMVCAVAKSPTQLPVHAAATQPDLHVLSDEIDAGTPVDARDWFGNTALHLAAKTSQKESVKKLLLAGAAVNAKTLDGSTPLWYAIAAKDNDLVKLLLDAGADVDVVRADSMTLLHLFATTGPDDLAPLLLRDRKARCGERDRKGVTPLLIAAAGGRRTIVQELLRAGADPNPETKGLLTPLQAAEKNGHTDIAKDIAQAIVARRP